MPLPSPVSKWTDPMNYYCLAIRTAGSGHYMYLETTDGTFGSTARLISPRFHGSTSSASSTNAVTLTFWASKNGEELGDLRCLTMTATSPTTNVTTSNMQQILEVPGVLGNNWVKKNVTFLRPSSNFHVRWSIFFF